MDSASSAERVIENLDGRELDGRRITVQKSKRKVARPSTPGRYLGLGRRYEPRPYLNRFPDRRFDDRRYDDRRYDDRRYDDRRDERRYDDRRDDRRYDDRRDLDRRYNDDRRR